MNGVSNKKQVNQMARTADLCQSCGNHGRSSTNYQMSDVVFERGRPGLQSSTLPLSVHPSRGGRPWTLLSKWINQSVPLTFLWDPLKIEYAKQNANQLSGKSAGL